MLPATLPLDLYRTFRRDIEAQRPAMETIALRHGLPPGELAPFSQGTQIVWGTQRSVIKLFVPTWPEDTRIEMLMLERLVGAGLPVPQLEARGGVPGWPYVGMSPPPGHRVPERWPEPDADAFVGPWTYELAATSCFVTQGDRRSQRALLSGRGVETTPELLVTLRCWAVLHRYGHVATMMQRAGHASLWSWLDTLWLP